MRQSLFLVVLLALATTQSATAQDTQPEDIPPMPEIPTLEEVQAGGAEIEEFIPVDFSFRIGVVGEFQNVIETESGTRTQIKSPLILIDPSTGAIGVYAKDFPARIVANSSRGNWVVGIAASTDVEGSSGRRDRECAVSLDLLEDEARLVEEFPLHSQYQAFFSPSDENVIYYCVNEPAAVNQITRYHLADEEKEVVPTEGNRFYMYGLKQRDPRGTWIEDPFSMADYPVLSLIDLESGESLRTIPFRGCAEVIASPDGNLLLAVVRASAEASLGYYQYSDNTFHQVSDLVFTLPEIKWTHRSRAVIVKESTATLDRLLWVDLDTNETRELFSAYFKIALWDISPDDDALVFITTAEDNPILFVVPIDPEIDVINRIRLRGVTNISWVGCLYPPTTGGTWWERLLPF